MGEKCKREKAEGRGERGEGSLSEQRRAGRGGSGREQAGRRLHSGRWRERRPREKSPAGSPASAAAAKFVRATSLRGPWGSAGLGGVGEPPWPAVFVLGDLALLSDVSKSSWTQALHALAFARASTPGFSDPLALEWAK